MKAIRTLRHFGHLSFEKCISNQRRECIALRYYHSDESYPTTFLWTMYDGCGNRWYRVSGIMDDHMITIEKLTTTHRFHSLLEMTDSVTSHFRKNAMKILGQKHFPSLDYVGHHYRYPRSFCGGKRVKRDCC